MAPKKKKIKSQIKLQVKAGQANPAPPVGPALGQHGLNIMDFCNQFNERTKEQMGLVIPVIINVYEDRTFSFVTKTPPASVLLKRSAKLAKASPEPNKTKVGSVTDAQIQEIAELKMVDLNAANIDTAKKMVAGTARSMGLRIEG